MKKYMVLVAAMMMIAGMVSAQEVEGFESAEIADTLIANVDTVEIDPDPEWYVAPLNYDSVMARRNAPRRAAAANCPIDSVLTFDIDSILTDVVIYEYGDTTRTVTWAINPDGSRVGVSKEEEGNINGIQFSAAYEWDNTTNNWRGIYKEEHTYEGGSETVRILYNTWQNNTWAADTKYTWVYDATGRETEYTTYTRNTSSNELILSQQRLREYNAVGKTTLDIQYTAHNGTTWSAGTKKEYDYDNAGNQIELTNYGSLSNGTWVGSTREEWTYNAANKKTYYAKQTWKNGAWSNTSKEEYAYNAANKQTLKIVYTGSGNTWTGSTKEETDYNASGKTILSAKYKWKNGAWVGNGQRTETSYVGDKASVVIYSFWSTNDADWMYASRRSYLYNNAGKVIADTTKNYTNAVWVNYALVTHAFDNRGNDTLSVTSGWDGAEWVATSVSKGTYLYTASGLPLLVETYTGLESSWTGKQKIEYAYNDAEEQILYLSYDWYNGDWRYKLKNEKSYDAANHLLLNETYSWSNSQWVGSDKYEYAYDVDGRQSMNSRYIWSNNAWKGISRTDKEYYSDGKEKTTISYTWSNDDWEGMFRYDYVYDQAGRTIDRLISRYQNNDWAEEQHYTYTFDARGQEIASYEYRYINSQWIMVSKHEKTFDPSDNKLRRDITGSWSNTGNLSSYSDVRYAYACDPHYFIVRFENYDGNELQSSEVLKGEIPVYSGAEPIKPATEQYTYSFKGWSPAIVAVTGDAVYTAEYDSVVNSYRITWLDADDAEVAVDSLAYGAMPSHEDLVKTNTVEWTYSFVGWTPAITSVTADATYKAQFDSVRNSYRIIWLDVDDTELAADSLSYGAMPSHEYVLKANTAEWTYSFVGWTPEIVSVTADATYKAQIDSVRNRYRVTWLDADDTELAVDSLAYGATPSREYVLKANTAEWTYSFVGWTPEIVAVTGDATYKAQLDSVINTYLVTFKNGQETLQSTQVAYGSMPVYEGDEPTKQGDAQYTYSFNGWDAELVSVTGEATYNATFSSTINNYRITFKNGADTLQSTLVAYGTMPVYGGETPTKQADAQYTYSFNGWDAELVAVTGETTYDATFSSTINNYTITWLLDDGTKIDEQSVAYGTTPSHTDAHKDNTAQYTITFAGWDKEFAAVTGDETYTAVFDSVVNRYTVIFYFEDGVTVLDSKEWKYGEMPSTSLIPSLPATPKYTYTFAGWSPELQPVTGNAIYTPVFDSIVNIYTVTFVNYNNMVLQSSQVPYDDVPEYTGETPTKPSSYKYHYVFTGWTPELVAVTGDARYKAVFEQVLNSYTILFYDEDGLTILDSVEVDHGEMPETSVIPTKEDDEEYTYTFAGWSPKIVSATRNTSYTATYTATRKTEGLWDVEAAEKAQKVMIDGVIYIRRGGKIYTLNGTEVE